MRNLIVKLKEFGSTTFRGSPFLKTVLIVLAGILLIAATFWAIDKVLIYYLARSYSDELANAFGLNRYAAQAILWCTFGAAVVCFRFLTSFSKKNRHIGAVLALFLLVGHSLLLWYATKDATFDRQQGVALKWYVVTRDAIRYCTGPGVDSVTGRECKAVTPEVAERLQRYENGARPHKILDADTPLFASATGNPVAWYSAEQDGNIQLFDLMGFDPETGNELKPITADVAKTWKLQIVRRPPNRVDDPDRYGFFDELSGRPRVWYRKTDSAFEFYDGPGFHPGTGEPLKVIDRKIVEEYHSSKTTKHTCYIITRDATAPVVYGDHSGIDPATGRQCYPLTAQVKDRLNEYSKGRLPKRVKTSDPVFFDMRTGEPIIWYSRTKAGDIELFDLMGFHPGTGEELLPITKQIADEWKDKKAHPVAAKRAPNRVPFNAQTVVFDPVSGAPKLWFWRAAKGNYEFFDAPGFHPQNGEPLKSFTKDEALKYQQELTDVIKGGGTATDTGSRPITATYSIRSDVSDGIQNMRDGPGLMHNFVGTIPAGASGIRLENCRPSDDGRGSSNWCRIDWQGHEGWVSSCCFVPPVAGEGVTPVATGPEQGITRCDELAGSPTDVHHVGKGNPYDQLRFVAKQAADACVAAIKEQPTELRFKFQLARAMETLGSGAERVRNRERALRLHEELVAERYPAAFDNLGSLYRDVRKDYARAAEIFRAGIRLNDSDSMLSLADLIEKNRTPMYNPSEEPVALYKRAADLGNENGARAYQMLLSKEQDTERVQGDRVQRQQLQSAQQLQQQRMMLQFIGGVLGGVR